MARDKITETLVDALKLALAEPGEQRLYRSGKLPGLFASKTGLAAEAARRALDEGLLERLRTEERGKVVFEWVRPTPAGIAFLHAHESPRAILEELQTTLQTTQAGVPLWLDAMRQDVAALSDRLAQDIERVLHRLGALEQRVAEALRRAEGGAPALASDLAAAVPWAAQALAYLDQRRDSGATLPCPLPELYAALRRLHPDLALADFHAGLRRLADFHAIALRPFEGPPAQLREPEFALLDGVTTLFYASREK